MNKEKISMALLLLMLAGQAQAQECANANAEPAAANTEVSEADAVKALEALAKAGVVVIDEQTRKLKLREDLLEKLKAEGKLNAAYGSAGSFCM